MLIDTHVFLWWLFNDPKLSENIKTYLKDPNQTVFVSSASVWEIAAKFRLGKLSHAKAVAKDVPFWIEKAHFKALSVTVKHAQLAGDWKQTHRDPFDRMLAAQSKIEEIPLATQDKVLSGFDIEIIC